MDLECPSEAFQDLDTGRWYHEYTDYVIAKGLMNGMDETHFAPEGSLTRGMLVTALYRLAGEPEVTEPATFTDVAQGRYYADAVAWAGGSGHCQGHHCHRLPARGNRHPPAGSHLPVPVCHRVPGARSCRGADLTAFTDGSKVQDYAKTAMSWAVAEGFFEGLRRRHPPSLHRFDPGPNGQTSDHSGSGFLMIFLARIPRRPFVEHWLFRKGMANNQRIQYSCGFAAGWLPKQQLN